MQNPKSTENVIRRWRSVNHFTLWGSRSPPECECGEQNLLFSRNQSKFFIGITNSIPFSERHYARSRLANFPLYGFRTHCVDFLSNCTVDHVNLLAQNRKNSWGAMLMRRTTGWNGAFRGISSASPDTPTAIETLCLVLSRKKSYLCAPFAPEKERDPRAQRCAMTPKSGCSVGANLREAFRSPEPIVKI